MDDGERLIRWQRKLMLQAGAVCIASGTVAHAEGQTIENAKNQGHTAVELFQPLLLRLADAMYVRAAERSVAAYRSSQVQPQQRQRRDGSS